MNVSGRDLLSIDDLQSSELRVILNDASAIRHDALSWSTKLLGKQVALIFEKPSTRTRVSFEVAVTSMGGHPIVLRGEELQLGRGETIEDTGRVLSRYVDAIVIRTFGQDRLERLADAAAVPVINALSDYEHPCQGIADLQTMSEKLGGLEDRVVAYIGDGNNVAHSLMLGGVKMGMEVRVACPAGYEPFSQVVDRCHEISSESQGTLRLFYDPLEAASGAHVLYTDVWTSMGQDDESEKRRRVLAPFQVNSSLVDAASRDVIVMHCLPAHRGEEITAEVMDGPRSVVWDQAENRLHSQRSLLAWFLR